jgi:hypothetical protein
MHACIYVGLCMYIYIYIYVCVYIYIYIYIGMYVCARVCMYMYMYVCMHERTYVCVRYLHACTRQTRHTKPKKQYPHHCSPPADTHTHVPRTNESLLLSDLNFALGPMLNRLVHSECHLFLSRRPAVELHLLHHRMRACIQTREYTQF